MTLHEQAALLRRRLDDTSPLEPTVRSVYRVATPLILSTVTWTVQSYIDRLLLSWHSVHAIAAVVPAGCLTWAAIGPLDALVGFANTLVAQYHGSGQRRGVGLAIAHAFYLALTGGLLLLLLVPLVGPVFRAAGHETSVLELETVYGQIVLLSGLPTLLGTAASCFFSGLGRTWVVLWVNAAVTLIYIPLDYLLIFGLGSLPGYGIVGAAWATVLAAWIEAVLFVAFMLWFDRSDRYAIRSSLGMWRPRLLRLLLRYGGPEGMMVLADLAAWTWFELVVGRLGVVALAATNMAFNVNSIVLFPLNGLSLAVSTLVAQQIGRGSPRAAKQVVWSALWPAALLLLPICTAFFFVPQLFLAPFAVGMAPSDYARLEQLAATLLRFVAAYTFFDLCVNVFAGALRGAGDTRFVLIATLAIAAGVLVLPSAVLAYLGHLTVLRLWALATAYIGTLGVTFAMRMILHRSTVPIV